MDTDGSRQIFISIIFFMIEIILFFNSRFNILNTYIFSNIFIVNLLKEKLTTEGYCIKNVTNCIYLIYPVLYGERE